MGREASGIKLNKEDFPDYKSYKKEYDRQYTQLTKERRKQQYHKSPERHRKYARDQHRRNLDKINERLHKKREEYYEGKNKDYKPRVQAGWRKQGIKYFDDTFDKFFDTKICETCNCELQVTNKNCANRKCLDHDHFTGLPRNIICSRCNNYRHKYDNLKMKIHLELYRYFQLK
tara:strand:+ start:548 stop:1069 length:522 start_codon:yes stop_codon:yes gene_type:complete